MQDEQIKRLQERMTHLGYNETTLAIAAGVGRTAVNDIIRGKSKSPGIDLLIKLCKVLGMSAAELLDGQARPPLRVPIIGEITYGDRWHQYKSGKTLPDILDLWTSNDDLIAVRVLESSMSPRYQRGDVVLGNRVVGSNADNYIGLHCIIKTTDDQTYVKVLTRGSKPGVYALRSLDPSIEDVRDVHLVWFAPVVSILPQGE